MSNANKPIPFDPHDQCKARVMRLQDDLTRLQSEKSAAVEVLRGFVRDFESDFVLEGVIVDNPSGLWGPIERHYRAASAISGGAA